jgi:DNA-binding NtrC family response regulator
MKILVVDDNRNSLYSLSNFLSDIGHDSYEASDGEEALKIVKSSEIDLIISDIRMPNLSGTELLKIVKGDKDLAHIEVILMTGYGDIESAVKVMKMGGFDYLLKPIDINEIAIKIEKIGSMLSLKRELKITKEEFKKNLLLKEGVSYSDSMNSLYKFADKIHTMRDLAILIEGETGVGKEVLSRYIHYGKDKVAKPFVAINCAAINPSLFESELFGYEKGAFTGGNPKGQIGKIELAEGGTLLLDEVGELPNEFQAKLLRFIQEREYYPIGGTEKRRSDIRIICATNIDIEKGVEDGSFRKDLYYRLSSGHIKIPPLRERVKDIVPLAYLFLGEMREKGRTEIVEIEKDAEDYLAQCRWDGNVRELKSCLEKVTFFVSGEILRLSDLRSVIKNVKSSDDIGKSMDGCLNGGGFSLNDHILDLVETALEKFKWNKSETAEYLGVARSTLYSYIKRLEEKK